MVLLAALAGGAGGEAGKQAWSGLSALVRRPLHRADGVPAVSSGEAELAALEEAPGPERANALSTALAVRATLDAPFRTGLQQWHDQARVVRTGDGEVTSTISGGTFHAPVVQGRDFSGVSFATAPPPPSSAPTDDTAAPRT
ncbi:hypothetical protein ACFV7Q_32725 [Streptomyces sp. NPDC059851]|uniref:hypothetical protein n=1 Tax=Streptomyces sp. NPDC059851 TaxID=3346971 RepID=UPI0036668EFB